MQLSEGKERFISEWGKLSTNWGVSKTMGQIHALLLVNNSCLCTDTIMEHLDISRGNVNTNIENFLMLKKTFGRYFARSSNIEKRKN